MSLFDKFSTFLEESEPLLSIKPDIFGTKIEKLYSSTEASIDGRKVLLAGTNNYLGLTFAPECIAAAHKAIDDEGTGTTGSRMANGNYDSHRALERELADFYNCATGIVFSTGYQANLGTISGLVGSGDVLLIDAHCHASIYDGCKLSGAEVIRFRHNDVADLDKRLNRLGDRARSTLIMVEGIYSMLGDTAPLAEITKCKEKYGSYLLIDEAHSLGVLGDTGQGLVEVAGVGDSVDFITGTFSKSLGSIGGYCVSNHQQLEVIRYLSRPYIFTASPSPSNIASARAALVLLKNGKALRERLWGHANKLYSHLLGLGLNLGPEPGPVISAQVDSEEEVLRIWSSLIEKGVYVNLIFPPASPQNKPLIRISVSAAHTEEQIDFICNRFSEIMS
ncbi:MAG: serine palmitoyltransferase [Gammaproteobacteria bacterium]|jgi:8-amino-7-oxononanoate synthase